MKKREMKEKRPVVLAVLRALILALAAGATQGGSLDAPVPPTSATSAMYTLLDLYNRLVNGTAGTKRAGAFTEPTGGPTSGTMKTLDEIMAEAPSVDDVGGAGVADVPRIKTFWGLTSGAWGRLMGLAAPARVPATGQTATAPIDTSSLAGADGALRKGVAWPSPRFTDNSNGTVTDNLTGLVWLKNANAPDAARNWATALSDVASLNSTGKMNGYDAGDTSNGGIHQTDWRLPNHRELFSLVDFRYSAPALCNKAGTAQWTSGDPFTGVQTPGYYWSSTTSAVDSNSKWAMGISNGSVGAQAKTSSGVFVWPVRGGLTCQAGSFYARDPVVGNLRYVPAGTFIQGSPTTESGHGVGEAKFTHILTKNLVVMETEVTRQMWADLQDLQPTLPDDPTDAPPVFMSNPARNLFWYEAVLFANLLSAQSVLTRCYYADAGFATPITRLNYSTATVYCNWGANGYRLPSEGEWEYFCRAGTTTPFSVNEPNYSSSTYDTCNPSATLWYLGSVAWWCANAGGQTNAVGGKDANPWNLKDVHGNVFEWCWDWLGTYPSFSATDYRGAGTGVGRVVRGGSWSSFAQNCRSAMRSLPNIVVINGEIIPTRDNRVGFRLVRTSP